MSERLTDQQLEEMAGHGLGDTNWRMAAANELLLAREEIARLKEARDNAVKEAARYARLCSEATEATTSDLTAAKDAEIARLRARIVELETWRHDYVRTVAQAALKGEEGSF